MSHFYSNGKLLLTGEYVVLDGALSLALPTTFGQSLQVEKLNEPKLLWESYSSENELWLQVEFDLPQLKIVSETFNSQKEGGNDSFALTLQCILQEAKKLNSNFLNNNSGFYVKTTLTFPQNWGLGSSSTLINNIANWANINAFTLQFNTFGGSGYDIACAQHKVPITYQLKNSKPIVNEVSFNPSFKDQLYFVHLNKKQNSREGIAAYKKHKATNASAIAEISAITMEIISCNSLTDFEHLLKEHENIIASISKQKTVQQRLFADYTGQTKSLGAWGGDFILATGNEDAPIYFKLKGFNTIIPYSNIIL